MKISIIVPAYNEEKLITETLGAITTAAKAFAARGWQSELIVCDNNSTDRTRELAEAAGAQVVFEPINQIARARNTGARAASGNWLLFIDADCWPATELFTDVADAIATGCVLSGGSTIHLDSSHQAAVWSSRLWNCISLATRLVAGSFIFCETAAFRELGGFDQQLFASEEIELGKRLKKLARRKRRKVVILHGHPLRTSGRKFHLYSAREYLRFLYRTALHLGGTLKSPHECHLWYDGRR